MAAPVYIAVNQTGSDVQLVQLARLVPASGSANLSDYNTTSEIQDDRQLRELIEAGTLLLSDGVTMFTKEQSLQYMTTVAAPTPVNPMTTRGDVVFGGASPAGAPTRLAGVNGAYLRSGGSSADPTFVRVLDVEGLVADVSVGASLESSAIIQANSTSKGFLIPRMTEAQMLAIESPATGLIVYNTTRRKVRFWDGAVWRSSKSADALTVEVSADGSSDFSSIQAAIDSITDASDTKRYTVSVAPGVYEENVTLKDYVQVVGAGWDTLIRGTVTSSPVDQTLQCVRVESTNAPAVMLTGAVGSPYELDLIGCFLYSTWDDTAAPGVVRCIISQDSGLLYLYGECSIGLTVNDTVNTSDATWQAIWHTHGDDPIFMESWATWCELHTNNPGNSLAILRNTSENAQTFTKVLSYGTTIYLEGEDHDNLVHGLKNDGGNGMYVIHSSYLMVMAYGSNTAKIHAACSEGSPDGCRVVCSLFTIYKQGIADANVYVGSSSGANDHVELDRVAFFLDSDVKPLRYTAHGTAGTYKFNLNNNFGTVWSSGLFNDAEVGADVTDWDNVSAALGGQAGSTANLVFKSDGAGGGAMVPNKQVIARRLTVGLSGDVDYTSIKTAIEAAIAGGANATNWWQIEVYPGTYTEAPMVLQPGISLVGLHNRMNTAVVAASNAAEDLFTCTGGYMAGFVVRGVTDSSKCLFRMSTANTQTVFHGVSVLACSTGWDVSNGAACLLNVCSAVISGPSQGITTWAKVSGSGSYLGCSTGYIACPAAVLPYYTGNPIQTVFRATNGAKLLVAGASYRVAPKDSTADVVLADGGAQVTFIGAEISDSGNALHIGSSGSNTKVIASSLVLTNNTLNVYIESSSGVVFANFSTDIERKSIVSGGRLLGLIQYRDNNLFRLIGSGKFRFDTGSDLDLTDFFYDIVSTGLCDGGVVTAGTGLKVDVSAGEGFIRRDGPYYDAFSVSWDAASDVSLTTSSTNYVFFDSTDSTVKTATSAPGGTGILLAIVITDGSGVRFIHRAGFNIANFQYRFDEYLRYTRKVAFKTGLTTTQGTGPTKFSVNSGSYYLSMTEIFYAGSGGDATWSYFYGTNGATEVPSVSSLDTGYYDNAGTLTAMTSGYYRADTLYLTSDGRLSLIYGTAQHATRALAEADTAMRPAPTFIEPSACSLAQVVVQQGMGIVSIVDRRPSPGSTVGGGGGTNSHSALADLDKPADHPWAMLVDGTRAMTGNLNMGTKNVTNVGTVDGVTVSAHASRHNPGGSDAVATGTPVAVSVGATPAEGTASSFARSDHQHGVSAGTPVSVGTGNSAGSASTVARSDHVHDHGTQSTATHHAVATTGANGFMSSTDKAKLDGIASGATNTPLSNTAPVNVTKSSASAGTSGEAARQDHKHDVSTAVAIGLTPGDTVLEGVSTSLARADHRHSLPAFGTTSGTFCQGNDSRLSDARTPTAHAASHQNGGSDEVATATAAANAIPKAGSGAKLDIGWIPTGTTNLTVCIGNDSRLSDARTPLAHATSHKHGGSDEVATATAAANAIPKATVDAKLDIGWIPTGTTNLTVCIGNDSRLSDARTPLAHASSHHSGGSDQVLHQSLSGAGTNTHAQIDTHISSTNNPHSTTASQVGLGNVTNDAQLKRAAGDFASFAEKAAPVTTDLALIEDSAAGNAKKYVQLGNLPRRWPWSTSSVLTVDASSGAKADHTTIAAAISAAVSGTVILVAPGTYDEVLTLKDGVSIIGMGSTRYGGNQVLVMHSGTAGFDLLTKDSAGTAYLENIVFVASLSGTSSGTVSALNLVSGGVRAKDCLFQAMTSSTAGAQVVRGVRSTAYFQATRCSFVASDSNARNTSIAAVATSSTLEADSCKFSMGTSSSTEGALYVTGGTTTIWEGHFTAGGGQPIRRTGGTINLYGAQHLSGTETDDTDDPSSASTFVKSNYGVLLTNGQGSRAYKLPCRVVSGDVASPSNGDIWYNGSTGVFRCYENGSAVDLRGGSATDVNAIHKNVAGEISTVTEKTTPVGADLLLIEDSAASNNKKRLQVTNLLPQFGRDYRSAVSEGTSTTTSSTFQTKVTLTTGALTGVYKVEFQAELTIASTTARFQVRLYNSTNATEECFHDAPAVTSGAYKLVSGFDIVTFTGASKTFLLQFASQNNATTVTIRRARILLHKVSA